MLGFRFSYLYKLHTEAFMGFNAVCLPGNPPGALYRSSLPATPVSTPIRENGRFSEQALRERLCRTPSPRKCRLFESRVSEPDLGLNDIDTSAWPMSSPDSDEIDENPPPERVAINPVKTVEKPRDLHEENEEKFKKSYLDRKVFVGNISYRINKNELRSFFRKFGKVVECTIVQDHIRKWSKGYGFVVFASAEDAQMARSASSSELELDGRVLRVFAAEEKQSAIWKKDAKAILLKKFDAALEEAPLDGSMNIAAVRISNPNNINDLNDHILLTVFSYLGIMDRVRIERVCKRWKFLALRLWHMQYSLHFLHVFSVFSGRPLTNIVLSSILKKCSTHLKKLDLSTASHSLDYRAVEVIAQMCPNLEEVNLTGIVVTNVSLQQLAIKCQKLKIVILKNCCEFSEKGVWWMLHLCKKLEHVDVSGNTRLTGQCFHMASLSLRKVALNGCSKFSPVGFTKVATMCRNLSNLYVDNCSELSDRALELLCQSLKNLKVLHVGGFFKELTCGGLHHIGRLNNLEQLSLCKNDSVDDDVIYAISRGCRKLRYLDISCCYMLTDSALASLASCIYMKTLYINYLDKISDDGLSSIARQGQLEVVQTRGCYNLRDQGFITLVLLCPFLVSLDISGCERVTNITLQTCLDTVSARATDERLMVTIGGTSMEPNKIAHYTPKLDITTLNLCQTHLMRGYTSCFEPYDAIDEDEEDEEMEEELQQGAASATSSTAWQVTDDMVEDFLAAEDPAMIYDNEWEEQMEAPF